MPDLHDKKLAGAVELIEKKIEIKKVEELTRQCEIVLEFYFLIKK